MVSRNQIVRGIYEACDEEFGGQHRAEAIQHADALVASYEVDRPKIEIQALQLMPRAYRKVAERRVARTRNEPRPASREPGATEDLKEFQPGSLDQVKADMASRMKAGTCDPHAFAPP